MIRSLPYSVVVVPCCGTSDDVGREMPMIASSSMRGYSVSATMMRIVVDVVVVRLRMMMDTMVAYTISMKWMRSVVPFFCWDL